MQQAIAQGGKDMANFLFATDECDKYVECEVCYWCC